METFLIIGKYFNSHQTNFAWLISESATLWLVSQSVVLLVALCVCTELWMDSSDCNQATFEFRLTVCRRFFNRIFYVLTLFPDDGNQSPPDTVCGHFWRSQQDWLWSADVFCFLVFHLVTWGSSVLPILFSISMPKNVAWHTTQPSQQLDLLRGREDITH